MRADSRSIHIAVRVQFTSRLRSFVFALSTMPFIPSPYPAAPRPLDEIWLYKRGVFLGFDGGLLNNLTRVFVVPMFRHRISRDVTQQINTFEGLGLGVPIARMEDGTDYPALALVGSNGFVGKCVIHIQRRWRRLRAKRYEKSMVRFGLLLANALRRGRKLPDQIDTCQRKREKSDPSRGGGEPSYKSQRRN